MIINKTYEFNQVDIDSVIVSIAEDIKNGFTIKKMERLPLELSAYAYDLIPSVSVTLHNKKADEYGWDYYKAKL